MVFQVAKAAEAQNQANPELSVRTPASPPAARGDGGVSLDFGVYSYGQQTDSQAAAPASQEGASGGSLPFGVHPEVQPPPQAPSAEPAGAASTAVDDVQSPPRKSDRKKAPVNALKASDLAAPAHPKKGKDKAGDDVSTPKKVKAKAPEKASPEMPSLRALRMRQRAGEGMAGAGSPPSSKRQAPGALREEARELVRRGRG
jgi:hypothetical protein